MNWPVIFDTVHWDFYHIDCFPEQIRLPTKDVKHAMISIKNCQGDLLTAFIRERKHSFFCSGCGHLLVQAWSYDLRRSRFHGERVMKFISQIQETNLASRAGGAKRKQKEVYECYDASRKNQVVWFEFGQRKKLDI